MHALNATLLSGLLLICTCTQGQENRWAPAHTGVHLVNLDYVVDFDTHRGVASWVAYELLPTETQGETKRKSGFKKDVRLPSCPAHKDYTHSGYDRGHLKPAADSKSSAESMAASFLMTNVAPQTPQLNRGSWKQLEAAARDWAHEHGSVHVVCGPGQTSQGRLPSDKVDIPTTFWKAILRTRPDTACIAFMMPNQTEKLDPFSTYRISVDSLETAIGLDLFPQLPDSMALRIEDETNSHWTGLAH